jgi:hypothetical protein
LGNRTIPAFVYCPFCGRFLGDAIELEMIPGAQNAAFDILIMSQHLDNAVFVNDQARALRKALEAGGDVDEARQMLFDALDLYEEQKRELDKAILSRYNQGRALDDTQNAEEDP